MIKIKSYFFCFFVLIGLTTQAQESLVKDGALPEAEFNTVINPLDSNNIVIATQNGFGNSAGGFNLSIYYTKDFGTTWQKSNYTGLPTGYQFSGDPVLSFDDAGNVYLVNLGAAGSDVNTLLSKSSDGGATWTLVATIASGNTDKPWLAIDRYATSTHKGNIYVPLVANNIITYTLNSSYQKTDSVIIPDGDQLPCVAVTKNGTVYTSTVDLNTMNTIYVQKYANGGASLVHSTQVVSFPDKTFNAPDISLRFQPTPYITVDNSGGTHDGRVYLSYTASETVDPSYFDVFLAYSDDGGLTWSAPKIVNSVQQNKTQQFYSSLFVNDNGVLLMDWYDRKNYSNTSKLTDFYLGISTDGGNSFTETKLNSVSTDFTQVIPSSNDFGIGEYHQLVATKNYTLAFWSDGRTNNGDLNLYMAKVNINAPTSVEELSVVSDKISVSDLYPQPAGDIVYTKLKLREATKMKYTLYDQHGQIVIDAPWSTYGSGEHTLAMPCNVAAGLYYVNITSDKGYSKKIKLIKQ